jgi:transcriptional regulator with GAF, ATPase, and Fis domain
MSARSRTSSSELILSTGSALRLERAHISRVLEGCGWKIDGKGHAAEKLGLHPNTLRPRMRKARISRPALSA